MDKKETLLQATLTLIEEKGEQIDTLTVREICQRAQVGVGLLNYHFGSKEKLIELCVERIVNGIVEKFHRLEKETESLSPFEKLEHLGNRTFTFLFEHHAVAKISILADMRTPREDDNTHKTYFAYLPLVAACRPNWDKKTLERKTLSLIALMQQSFLRHQVIRQLYGTDLTDPEERKAFYNALLTDILER